jgi:hypothetical protein
VRRDAGYHEVVAVRVHACDRERRGNAAGARAILDEELLLKRFGQIFRRDAPQRIGGAAGRERRDNAHRPRRPFFCPRLRERRNGYHQQAYNARRKLHTSSRMAYVLILV